MADRYWVGGGGNWTDTAHWSASSGGATGASVPTSADNAIIDSNSGFGGGGTISLTGSYYDCKCANLTANTGGHSYTIDYVSSDLSVYGNFYIESTVSWNSSTWLYLVGSGSHTIQTNGVAISEVYVGSDDNGTLPGGTYTLSGDLTCQGFHVASGTFDANDYDITMDQAYLHATAANITVNMGAGDWSIGDFYAFEVEESGFTATINAETSRILYTGSGYFYGFGKTVNKVELQNTGETLYLYDDNNTIGELVLPAGSNLRLRDNYTQVITKLNGRGESGSNINIDSATITCDSYFGGVNNDWWFYIGDIEMGGQAFTGDGNYLHSVAFQLAKNGTPTGNMTVKIYAETHATAYGTDSVGTGAALAESDAIDVSTLTTSRVIKTFTFTGANRIQLTNGTKYVAVVSYNNATWPDYLRMGWDNTSPTHAGNACYYKSATWFAQADRDCYFKLVTKNKHTISNPSGRIVMRYATIANSEATGGAQFFAGQKSTNSSGDYANTGWQFKDPQRDLQTLGVGP